MWRMILSLLLTGCSTVDSTSIFDLPHACTGNEVNPTLVPCKKLDLVTMQHRPMTLDERVEYQSKNGGCLMDCSSKNETKGDELLWNGF